MLEGYDLKALGLNSADYIHINVEAMKLAMADREKYLGDMDFIKIPYAGLLSKDYARERRKLIDPAQSLARIAAGFAGTVHERYAAVGPASAHRFWTATRTTPATPATLESWIKIATW